MNNKTNDSKTLIIVAIITVAGGCITAIIGLLLPVVTRFADMVIVTKTPVLATESVLIQNTATPFPAVQTEGVAQPADVYFPLLSEYISVKGYRGIVNSGGIPGDMKYSHLVTGKIKYERVEADDDIKKVELVCGNGQITDITGSLFLISQPVDSIFPNYASNEIDIPVNCRVDFTVIDTSGGQTGITIRSVAIP
jgi:hypothetical protein